MTRTLDENYRTPIYSLVRLPDKLKLVQKVKFRLLHKFILLHKVKVRLPHQLKWFHKVKTGSPG